MPDDDHEFSIRAIHRLLKNAGDKRVAQDAVKELREELEEEAVEIAKDALEIAHQDGRKTLRDRDIRQAIRNRG